MTMPCRVWLLLYVSRPVLSQTFDIEAAFGPGRVEEIFPTGGPVRGDTAITVYGRGLAGVECFFGSTIPGDESVQRSTCQASATSSDYGKRCVCVTPAANRPTSTVETINAAGEVEVQVVITGSFVAGRASVRAMGQFGTAWAPWDTYFNYYSLNTDVNITSIEPAAGNPLTETVVTVRGNGFFDYGGGVFCSYPGPHWDHNMDDDDPDYTHQDFTSPATVVSSELLLCHLAPLVNNTSPVFVEVCLNGHPDRVSPFKRRWRDNFCTASLHRFEYIDMSNLTIWNATVISGPIEGGTEIAIGGRMVYGLEGDIDFPDEEALGPFGLPDLGRPRCVFRPLDGSSTGLVSSPAALDASRTPLMFAGLSEGNGTVAAYVGRQRMCMAGDVHAPGDMCVCTGNVPLCGCGCRRLLQKTVLGEYDLCARRSSDSADGQEAKLCGPAGAAAHWQRAIPPRLSPNAVCITPPHPAEKMMVEYSPTVRRCRSCRSSNRSPSRPQSPDVEGVWTLVPLLTRAGRAWWSLARGRPCPRACEREKGRFTPDPTCPVVAPAPVRVRERKGGSRQTHARQGDVGYLSSSYLRRRVEFEFYESLITSATPIGAPITGGTEFTVAGQNLNAFGSAEVGRFGIFLGIARLYTDQPMCFVGNERINLTATLEGCVEGTRIQGWSLAEHGGGISGCTVLRCAPILPVGGVQTLELFISLNGRYDSKQPVVNITFYDNSYVSVSSMSPGAGPAAGGTVITVRGSSFADYGGANCILTSRVSSRAPIFLPATVRDNSTIVCPTTATHAAAGGGEEMRLGVVLNGQIATEVRATKLSGGQLWYFVNLATIQIVGVHPPAGPIHGGTTVLFSGVGLRACDPARFPALCPEPPLCFFEPTAAGGGNVAVSAPAPVTGRISQRGSSSVVECEAPPSGLTSSDVTEVVLPPEQLARTVRIGLLGHGQPGALLPQAVSFQYIDATVRSILPRGGPFTGGTILSITGSGFGRYASSLSFAADAGARAVGTQMLCLWIELVSGSVRSSAFASLTLDGGIRCVSPSVPSPPFGSALVHEELGFEVSLNGYAEEHTAPALRNPARYTYYHASVTYLAPFAGPALGGSLLRLQGRALADFGGLSCQFLVAGGGSAPSSVASASSPASALGGDRIACRSPPLSNARLAELRGGAAVRVDVRVALNGAQVALAGPCSTPLPPNTSCFAYFDEDATLVGGLQPQGGPRSGGTSVEVHGSGITDYGGVACKFGGLPLVPATLLGTDRARCVSPANGPLPSTGPLPLRISLNGADLLGGDAPPNFTYYDASQVRAATLMPDRAGSDGGTMVTVSGSGFVDLGGIGCLFGETLSNATFIDSMHARCISPAFAPNGTEPANVSDVLPAAVPFRLVLNGDQGSAAADTARANFTFYPEPCARRVVLRTLTGAFFSAFDGQYQTERTCSWLVSPGPLDAQGHAVHSLALAITELQLERGFDLLRVHDGPSAQDAVVLELPTPTEDTANLTACHHAGCSVAVRTSGASVLVTLHHSGRTRGVSRLSAVYRSMRAIQLPVPRGVAHAAQPTTAVQPDLEHPAMVSPVAAHAAEQWEVAPRQWPSPGKGDAAVPPTTTSFRQLGRQHVDAHAP